MLFKLLAFIVIGVSTSAEADDCRSDIDAAKIFFVDDYSFAFKPFNQIKSPLSPRFERLVRAETDCKAKHEGCAIDWDPWTSSSDSILLPGERLSLVHSTDRSSTVHVSFRVEGDKPGTYKQKVATIYLSRASKTSCWKIDDLQAAPFKKISEYLNAEYSEKSPNDRPNSPN